MMHKRRWCITTVATADELAQLLTERTWTLCSGFTVAGHEEYFFLNDATHEEGAGEYGVIKGGLIGPHVQIESITFSWASRPKALKYIVSAINGVFDDQAWPVTVRVERPEQHGNCHLCA